MASSFTATTPPRGAYQQTALPRGEGEEERASMTPPSNTNPNPNPTPPHSPRRSPPFHPHQHWLCLLLILPCFLLLFVHSTSTLALPGFAKLKMSQEGAQQRQLRVMTFNIWVSGANVEKGMEKIAKHIQAVDPDIVAIQEMRTPEVGRNLTQLLGPTKWKCISHPYAKYPDTAILTKHKFVEDQDFVHLQFERNITDFLFNEEHYENNSVVTYGMGASVQLEPDGQLVNFFSMHLDWRSYGPYAANNKQVTSAKQIMIGERNEEGYGRAQNIEQLLANEGFKKFLELSDKQPLIVAGDFNAPSHLDWTEETKEIHGGWAFEWPATKLIMDAGLNDSFRSVHPSVAKMPGITWSTVQKSVGPEWDWTIPEPQDRIDFIFYKPTPCIRPTNSFTYAGTEPLKPIPHQLENDWPSDHFAVVTEFALDLGEGEGGGRNNEVRAQLGGSEEGN